MKHRILGLLAAALLAGPMAANAVVIYEYTELMGIPSTDFSFSYASDTFISDDTFVPDYACVTATCDIEFYPTLRTTDVLIVYVGRPNGVGANFPSGSFEAVGSYDYFFQGRLSATLVVREVAAPEPGTLALLGLGLLGLGVTRPRRAN